MRCLDISSISPCGSAGLANLYLDVSHVKHRASFSSFVTVDLTHVDPRATCRQDPGACEVRNAVCDNEVLQEGNQKPSYHCLCRPGSAAVAAGVCVPDKCTIDVAKVGGRLSYGELNGMLASRETLKKCCEVGNKLKEHATVEPDERVEDKVDEVIVGPTPAPGKHEDSVGPTPAPGKHEDHPDPESKKYWDEHGCESVTGGTPDKMQLCPGQKINQEDKPELAYQKELDGTHESPQNVKVWTAAGIKWFNENIPGEVAAKIPKEQEGTKIEEPSLAAIEKSVEAKREHWKEHLQEFSRSQNKLEFKQRHLSSKQEWKNEMFAGEAGIMPLQEISGGTPNIRQQLESQDEYKLRFILPENTTAESASMVGLSDANPNLNADMESLVGKVSQAASSKAAMGMQSIPSSFCIAAALLQQKKWTSRLTRSGPGAIAKWSEFLS